MPHLHPVFAATMLALASLGLPACAPESKPVFVDQAWVRLNANPQAPSAAYFTVHGGSVPVTLRAVTAEAATRIEMHESLMQDGQMTMARIDSVAVPAGEKVEFRPGGRHVMLWGINDGVKAKGTMQFTFVFSNGDRILVDAPIRKAGEDAPAGKEHAGH
jgi:periplasmic copper chaperone A